MVELLSMSEAAEFEIESIQISAHMTAEISQPTGDLSDEVTNHVVHEEKARMSHCELYRRTAEAWNGFFDKHGSLSDEFSTL
jgi:hypothetical protein